MLGTRVDPVPSVQEDGIRPHATEQRPGALQVLLKVSPTADSKVRVDLLGEPDFHRLVPLLPRPVPEKLLPELHLVLQGGHKTASTPDEHIIIGMARRDRHSLRPLPLGLHHHRLPLLLEGLGLLLLGLLLRRRLFLLIEGLEPRLAKPGAN